MDFLAPLTPEQREAVLHIDGPLLILAGAGSGKPAAFRSRAAYLVGNGHAQPHEVLGVTFTNKAAEEMRARVESLVGADCRGMWLSTFHALCARLLRREAPAIGLSRDFVIYDSSDQLTVVKQAMKALHMDDSFVQPRAALSRIRSAKNRMESPEQIVHAAGWNRRDANIVTLDRNYGSTQIILDAASAVINQNRNRKDKHLWTDRKGGARIVYFRGGDELEEADFIPRTARGALADDVEATVAILYRTNAQSRTIEDALMREGVACN